MDLEHFRQSPVGTLVPVSGHDAYLGRDYRHMAFVPAPLDSVIPLQQRTYKMISEAHGAVGRLDFAVRRLPNPALLVRPALRREAQSTSALEGTYATLEEVLEGDLINEASRRAEVREVLNYVAAAERALELIKVKPICLTLLAELQAILVRDTRGDLWDRGKLRGTNVYIGERTRGIEASRFVPPPHGDVLMDGMSDWEKWLNADDDIPLLVKVAVGHYQFETLHPFSDGNGRLGRLIITLQLVTADTLTYPVLNLSPWLEERKDAYKDHLLAVSATGNFDPWVQFVAAAVIDQANEGVRRIEDLLAFRQELMDRLAAAKIRGVAVRIADSLIGYPIITPSQAAALHNVTYPPANNAIKTLAGLGVLREITGRDYGRAFVCDDVMRALTRH